MNTFLELDQDAMAKWRRLHGNESLDQQCERWTGYYEQWSGQGNENINGYGSAKAAQLASTIYTTDLSKVQLGDILFFTAPPYNHVTRCVGFDGARPIMSMASKLGDTLLDFGQAVKYTHADTYPHPFAGAAKAHDHNKIIMLQPWNITPPPAPAPGSGGIVWNAAAGDKLRLVNSGAGYQYWEPYGGPLARTLMQALKNRGRISISNYSIDANPGKETRKGIQRTLSITGIFKGDIDGVIASGGSHGIQTYGSRAKNHPYTGKIDGVPQQNSWVGFVNNLIEP